VTPDPQAHYADVNLTGDLDKVTDPQLAAIDLLASLLTGHAGWRVTVEIDPSTVIVATPPVRDDTPTPHSGVQTAQDDENPSNTPAPAETDSEGLDGRTA
jgi:hypothetical protein